MTRTTTRPSRTTTITHASAHPEAYYKAPLIRRVYDEAVGKPYGWGILREEQLGCEVAARMLQAELSPESTRIVRSFTARGLISSAWYGFHGGEPVEYMAGVIPAYRNVKLPKLDIDNTIPPKLRQSNVASRLQEQTQRVYPGLLSIESRNPFLRSKIERNARVLGECALELAVIPLVELNLPLAGVELQNFTAMAANNLKTEVARVTQRDGVTPSVRQFIWAGSPAIHELMASRHPEVSGLALEICSDLSKGIAA